MQESSPWYEDVQRVLWQVGRATRIAPWALLAGTRRAGRTRAVTRARALALVMLREHVPISRARIGAILGANSSTVWYAEQRVARHAELRAAAQALRAALAQLGAETAEVRDIGDTGPEEA